MRSGLLFVLVSSLALQVLSARAALAAPDTVVAAVPRQFPPQYVTAPDGSAGGFAVEVMDLVAARAGLSVSYRVYDDWAAVHAAVLAGEADVIPNMGITPERLRQFAVTRPVETFAVSVFVRDDTADIGGWDDLSGRTVALVPTSVGAALLRDRADVRILALPTYVETLYALISGQADAIVQPEPVTWRVARDGRVDNQLKVVGPPVLEIKRAIAVRAGDPLLARLDTAAAQVVGSPEYAEVFARWYGRPAPFWTAGRTLAAMAALLLFSVAAAVAWRFHSVVRLNRDLESSQRQLRNINGALAALVGCNQALVRAADERELIDVVAFVIGSNLACRAVRIDLVRDDGGMAPAAAWTAAAEPPADAFVLSLLVVAGGERLGIIDLAPEDPNGFAEEELELLYQLADDVAFGIAAWRARAALRDSEQKYRDLIENLTDWVWEVDEDGRYTFASSRVAEMLGYAPHEVIGNSPFDTMPPEEATRVGAAFAEVMARRRPFQRLENLNVAKDGRMVILETSGAPIFDGEGRFRGYRGIDRDVTERHRNEAALKREAEVNAVFAELGRLLLEPVPMSAIAEMILDRGRRLTGSRRGSACHRERRGGAMVCATPGDADLDVDVDLECCGGVEADRVVFANSAGQLCGDRAVERVVSVPVKIAGEPVGRLTFADAARDYERQDLELAERLAVIFGLALRRAWDQTELIESGTKLATVTAAAQDGIVMMDADGRVTFWNDAAARIFGYSAEEMLGRPLHATLAGPEDAAAFERNFVHFRETGRGPNVGTTREVEGWRKDGSRVPVEVSLASARLGDAWTAVATVKDLTERKEAERQRRSVEQQLFQAQKMDALGTVAGGIGHNFNNMLLPVMALTELTIAELPEGHPGRRRLESVLQASRSARDLVARVLTFARRDAPAMEPARLDQVVAEGLELLRTALPPSIELRVSLNEIGRLAMVDRSQIQTVVMNLGGNAADALDDRPGVIEVTLDEVDLDGTEAPGKLPAGRYARLTVRDDGPGMDAETLARIYDPFFTTKSVGKGTGMGLATAQAIVAGHGGAIAVDSRPGAGATFTVHLPLAPTDQPTAPQSELA